MLKCDKAAALVAEYADGELHALERRRLEKHLRHCAFCAARHAELLALRERLRAEAPYFAAPAGLLERVEKNIAANAARHPLPRRRGWLAAWLSPSRPTPLRWAVSGAVAGCAATLLAFAAGSAIVSYRAEHDIFEQAVAAHVQATLGDRLIEVSSSDQHTVKPWLSARLDYSPPVRDLASDGFALAGGRITDLDGRATATLVYRYRKHTIDVFVRPGALGGPPLQDLRGFNVLRAHAGGWDWVAVSDAETDVLERFLAKLVRPAAVP